MPEQLAFNMDCLEAMRQMEDNAFDLAVVDPPYGIGVQSMNFTKSGPRVVARNIAAAGVRRPTGQGFTKTNNMGG